MKAKAKPNLVKATRLILDEAQMYHLQPYSFRMDEVRSITRDYRRIHKEETCIVSTNIETVTLVANYNMLHDLWEKTLMNQQIIVLSNEN